MTGTTHEDQPSKGGTDATSQATGGQDPNHRNKRQHHPDTDGDASDSVLDTGLCSMRVEKTAVDASPAEIRCIRTVDIRPDRVLGRTPPPRPGN